MDNRCIYYPSVLSHVCKKFVRKIYRKTIYFPSVLSYVCKKYVRKISRKTIIDVLSIWSFKIFKEKMIRNHFFPVKMTLNNDIDKWGVYWFCITLLSRGHWPRYTIRLVCRPTGSTSCHISYISGQCLCSGAPVV
jgi:hypothetical protein